MLVTKTNKHCKCGCMLCIFLTDSFKMMCNIFISAKIFSVSSNLGFHFTAARFHQHAELHKKLSYYFAFLSFCSASILLCWFVFILRWQKNPLENKSDPKWWRFRKTVFRISILLFTSLCIYSNSCSGSHIRHSFSWAVYCWCRESRGLTVILANINFWKSWN